MAVKRERLVQDCPVRTNDRLTLTTVTDVRDTLPGVAAQVIAAVKAQVPAYSDLPEDEGEQLASAVHLALQGFLASSTAPRRTDTALPRAPAIEGAYQLGRGEANNGRTLDSLLSAYRVGAREAWQLIAGAAAEAGLSASQIVAYAAELFAYIDALSASSVSGYADELAAQGRVQERLRERLAVAMLTGHNPADVDAAANRASWSPPPVLAAVLVDADRAVRLHARLGERALWPEGDVDGLPQGAAVLLLPPDAAPHGADRRWSARSADRARPGPCRWRDVAGSFRRAARAWEYARGAGTTGWVDADDLLPELLVTADPDALADLRARVLQPLDGLPDATRQRLEETLRAWLLLRGRRDEVAAALYVHSQTVRYRMSQLRALFGDALDDQRRVLELVVALADEGRARQEQS